MTTPIAATSPETVTVTSYGAQTIGADRRRTSAAGTPVSFVGVVSPASPKDLERLAELARGKEVITVHSYQAIATANQFSNLPPDRITRNAIIYEVIHVDEWPPLGPIPRCYMTHAARMMELPPEGQP